MVKCLVCHHDLGTAELTTEMMFNTELIIMCDNCLMEIHLTGRGAAEKKMKEIDAEVSKYLAGRHKR